METVKCPHCKKEIELGEVAAAQAETLAAQKIREHKTESDKKIKALEKEKTDYWIKNLKQNDIPATKVNFPKDIFNDEHLKKTNFFKKNQHPTEGDLLYPSFPVEFDED